MIEHAPKLLDNTVDIIQVLKTNDMCYSDDQLIEETSEIWGDISSSHRALTGWDIKWGHKAEHIYDHDFRREERHFKRTHRHPRAAAIMNWLSPLVDKLVIDHAPEPLEPRRQQSEEDHRAMQLAEEKAAAKAAEAAALQKQAAEAAAKAQAERAVAKLSKK